MKNFGKSIILSVVKVIKIKAIIGVTNIHESIRKASKQKTAAV